MLFQALLSHHFNRNIVLHEKGWLSKLSQPPVVGQLGSFHYRNVTKRAFVPQTFSASPVCP